MGFDGIEIEKNRFLESLLRFRELPLLQQYRPQGLVSLTVIRITAQHILKSRDSLVTLALAFSNQAQIIVWRALIWIQLDALLQIVGCIVEFYLEEQHRAYCIID